MPKPAEPEPNRSKSRPERTIPSAFRASFGCSADSHPPDSSREWRCRTTYPMGSSRYDDSESITFIFFAPRSSSQNLSRVGGYSRAIRQEPHRKSTQNEWKFSFATTWRGIEGWRLFVACTISLN